MVLTECFTSEFSPVVVYARNGVRCIWNSLENRSYYRRNLVIGSILLLAFSTLLISGARLRQVAAIILCLAIASFIMRVFSVFPTFWSTS